MNYTNWVAVGVVVSGLAAVEAGAGSNGYSPGDPRHGGGSSMPLPVPSVLPHLEEVARQQADVARQQYLTKMRSVWTQTDQAGLARTAIVGTDAEVRRMAAGQLTDVVLLRKVYAETTDDDVRVIVVWKLRGVVVEEVEVSEVVRTALTNSRALKEQTVDLGGGVNLEMVWCPPGMFMMGSPADESERSVYETHHPVTLSKGFWMGKYEVTQEQWERVMGSNPSSFKGARNPVEKVSWHDCQEFIEKANRLVKGGGFRLPTEAEWEYACRAGTTTRFYSGDAVADLDRVGWYKANGDRTTHPVGQKKPNAWGLYDMHGNVWEWCLDWYDDTYPGAVTDPSGVASGSYRVQRGGSWYRYYARDCRSALRAHDYPSDGGDDYGFRLSRILP